MAEEAARREEEEQERKFAAQEAARAKESARGATTGRGVPPTSSRGGTTRGRGQSIPPSHLHRLHSIVESQMITMSMGLWDHGTEEACKELCTDGVGSGIPAPSTRSVSGGRPPTTSRTAPSGLGLAGQYANVKSSGYGPSRKAT